MSSNLNSSVLKSDYSIGPVVKDERSCCSVKNRLWCLRKPSFLGALFKRKGSFVTLLWSFTAFSVFHFIIKVYKSSNNISVGYFYYNGVSACVAALFVPIVGWMSDVYFGRYRVAKYSIWIVWICALALTVVHLLKELSLVNSSGNGVNVAISMLIGIMLGGLVALQSNIIQFGTDQLYDCSSYEITSYLILYAWSFSASGILLQFTQVCFCDDYYTVAYLVLPVLLTLTVLSDALFSHWLVKEPVTHNPLKLIFKVLCYAKRNKYPRLRSAFTYWEDKPYSRIDLAKDKYGGPFTTEQVEDVKSFFQISVVVGILSVFIGVLIHGANVVTKINFDFKYTHKLNCTSHSPHFFRECFKNALRS